MTTPPDSTTTPGRGRPTTQLTPERSAALEVIATTWATFDQARHGRTFYPDQVADQSDAMALAIMDARFEGCSWKQLAAAMGMLYPSGPRTWYTRNGPSPADERAAYDRWVSIQELKKAVA